MESFLHIKPKDIKLLKEDIQKVFDLTEDSEELTEEDVVKYMELADFFQDIADDIKQKVKDITGYESEDDTEEAEEDNTPEKPVLG
jgi:gas vesicle protein